MVVMAHSNSDAGDKSDKSDQTRGFRRRPRRTARPRMAGLIGCEGLVPPAAGSTSLQSVEISTVAMSESRHASQELVCKPAEHGQVQVKRAPVRLGSVVHVPDGGSLRPHGARGTCPLPQGGTPAGAVVRKTWGPYRHSIPPSLTCLLRMSLLFCSIGFGWPDWLPCSSSSLGAYSREQFSNNKKSGWPSFFVSRETLRIRSAFSCLRRFHLVLG